MAWEPRLETPISVRNLDDDPNETLKGKNGLKWTIGRTDGVGTPLGNPNQCAGESTRLDKCFDPVQD